MFPFTFGLQRMSRVHTCCAESVIHWTNLNLETRHFQNLIFKIYFRKMYIKLSNTLSSSLQSYQTDKTAQGLKP